MRYFLFIIGALFFTACSSSNNIEIKSKEPLYFQHLKYTKVLKVLKGEEVRTVVKVTYLNSVEPKKYDQGQNFLVSVYNAEKEGKYEVSLNDEKPLSMKEIEKNDPLYEKMALNNRWSKSYLYNFKNLDEKELNLLYKEAQGESLEFKFIKENN